MIDRHWHDVYSLQAVRTAKGANAWLWGTWAEPWKLFYCPDPEEGSPAGELIMSWPRPPEAGVMSKRPDASTLIPIMNEAHERLRTQKPRFW